MILVLSGYKKNLKKHSFLQTGHRDKFPDELDKFPDERDNRPGEQDKHPGDRDKNTRERDKNTDEWDAFNIRASKSLACSPQSVKSA